MEQAYLEELEAKIRVLERNNYLRGRCQVDPAIVEFHRAELAELKNRVYPIKLYQRFRV